MRALTIAVCVLALSRMLIAAETYPNAQLLIEPADLAKSAEQFVILDAREGPKYAELHRQDARWVDHAAWSKSFGDGDDAAAWSKRIGELGIDAQTKVAIYDDKLSKDAARIWWILRYWGVEDVRLINGGWKSLLEACAPFGSGTPAPPEATQFRAKPMAQRLATKEQLLRSLQKQDLQIVDSRSEAEFCGDNKQNNKRGGAIPGARHLEWLDLVEKESGRFKTREQLEALFASHGIDLKKPTAAHCQSGGRSSVMVFAMELMGSPQVSNYYKSWGEWGNSGETPIVAGQKK